MFDVVFGNLEVDTITLDHLVNLFFTIVITQDVINIYLLNYQILNDILYDFFVCYSPFNRPFILGKDHIVLIRLLIYLII